MGEASQCQAKTSTMKQCKKRATIGDLCTQHSKMKNVERVVLSSPTITSMQKPESNKQQLEEKAERQLKERTERQLKEKAERQLKEKAERQLKEKAERQLKERTERQLKEKAGRQLKEKAERQLKEKAERQLKERTERQLKERTERQLKEKAERQLKEQKNGPKIQIEMELADQLSKQVYNMQTCQSISCSPPGKKREEIVKRYTQNKKKSDNPIFVLLFGGMASGKSTVIKRLDQLHILPIPLNEFIYIDLDDLRNDSDEYRKNLNGTACQKTHKLTPKTWIWEQSTGTLDQSILKSEQGWINDKGEFVSSIGNMLDNGCRTYTAPLTWDSYPDAPLFQFMKDNYHIIYNVTCGVISHCQYQILQYVPPQYDIYLIGVKCNPDVAVQRSNIRTVKQGRFVPEQLVINSNAKFDRIVDQLVEYVSHLDNTMNKTRRLIVYQNDDDIEGIIHDRII